MRVLFNGLTALKPRTGVGQYCVRLAEATAKQLSADEFDVYPTPFVHRLVSKSLRFAGAKTGMPAAAPTRSQRLRKRLTTAMKNLGKSATALHFARHARMSRAELYHEPNYLPFDVDVPTVITVHDLSVLLHPEWHPADRVRQHEHRLCRAIAQAEHIITDTEQVKREIVAELGVKAAKVTAIPLGVGPEFAPPPREIIDSWITALSLPERYFLCVGTIEPRKNLLVVMTAFASLPASTRRQCPLLLAGPWGWRADEDRDYYERIGRAVGIRHLGYVPDDAMPALYSGATALLYPSLYEGFGLPPLEAVACGTPAICAWECAAVREVMATAALFVNAADIDGWRVAMMGCLDHVAVPNAIAERFTWSATAAKSIAVYQKVLGIAASLRAAA